MIEFPEEKFREMFFELKEKTKKDILKNNDELRTQWKKIIENSCREKQILSKLCAEDILFLENYKNERLMHDSLCSSMLYFQGYVDCVNLLKNLGIL